MKRFFWGFAFAFSGIKNLVRSERNARFHLAVTALLVPMMLVFPLKRWEVLLTIMCIVCVLAAEAFNSAIERLADRISIERDSLIGEAKDLAAGGVLLIAIGAAIVGTSIYIPHIFKLFSF